MTGHGADWKALRGACDRWSGRAGVRLVTLVETESSNDVLLRMPPLDSTVAVCLVRSQSAGRGTRGRVWQAVPDRTLTFSVARDLPVTVPLEGLSLAVSAALVNALARIGLTGPIVKWPNDLLIGDRKLGGILIEGVQVGERRRVVVGVGINLAEGAKVADRVPACLDELGPARSPIEQARRAEWVLRQVARVLRRWPLGRAKLLRFWQAHDALHGRPVRVCLPGAELTGIAMGITNDGHLIVQTHSGRRILAAGEVTVRKTD
ncbi:MAG: biotin--[acetyl-CoA-carboxylase] ligase [Halothiobacillaceae bacterium]